MLCLQECAPNTDAIEILCVDTHSTDDLFVQTLSSFETKLRWQVHRVDSLQESLQILKEKHFDVILFDLSLQKKPELKSLQTILARVSKIPVVVIASDKHFKLSLKAVQSGAQDVVFREHITADSLYLVIRFSIHRQQVINQVHHKATQDCLTHVYNRNAFMLSIQEAFDTSSGLFALLFIDLDDFKYINDHHGHHVGDQVLINIAKRLDGAIRKGDMLARLGGDEFCILIHSLVDHLEILPIINRISSAILSDVRLDNQTLIQVNASIGVALSNLPCSKPEELLACADLAMYHAKKNGKGFHQICTPSMYHQREYLQQFEKDMQSMSAVQGFEILYQPVVNLHTGWIFGVQALAHSQHPRWRHLSSQEFSPLLMSSSLRSKIRDWLLKEVGKQLSHWQSRDVKTSHLNVFLNLSHQELISPLISEQLAGWIQFYQLDPQCVWLSVPESLFETNSRENEHGSLMIQHLQQLGFQMYIDPFTAKSVSVDLFSHVSPKIAKIDVSNHQNTHRAQSKKEYLLKVMIDMCHQLEMKVWAHGVTHSKDLQLLKELACDYALGPSLFHELRPQELESWLV